MQQMKNFICAMGILLALLVWSVMHSDVPHLCILIASILMVLFSMRSLNDAESNGLMLSQFGLSAVFCGLATGYLPFLIFVEYRSLRCRTIRIVLPAILFMLKSMIWPSGILAETIYQAFILLLLSAILYGIEMLVDHYMGAQGQNIRVVTMTAVNEMYQRKLNQELRLKNYLIDKNARLEERENISRNIHNSVGHSITAAIMTLDAADMLFEKKPEQAREKMRIANGRIHEGLESIRHAVRVLDTENGFVSSVDFIRELQEIIDNFVMDTQRKIYLDCPKEAEEQQIPREHTEFLTGALQELLTNGVKHGDADLFRVYVALDSSHVRMRVVNNGKCAETKSNWNEMIEQGYGLKKIVSYTKRCGGDTCITDENGWSTEITLPFERSE